MQSAISICLLRVDGQIYHPHSFLLQLMFRMRRFQNDAVISNRNFEQNRASLAWLAVKWPKIGGRVNVQSLLPSNLCPLQVYASKSVSGDISHKWSYDATRSEVSFFFFFLLQKHIRKLWRKFIYTQSDILTITSLRFRNTTK